MISGSGQWGKIDWRRSSSIILLPVLVFLLAGCYPTPASMPETSNKASLVITHLPDSDTIVRLAAGEWQPYTGEKLPHYGCDAWAISEAFALEGIKVEYGFFPWARALDLAERGEWDGTLEWADIPQFQKEFYISADILSKQEWVFFYRKDHPIHWNSVDDLAGKRVGLTSGYLYSGAFDSMKNRAEVTFEEASNDEINLKKLLAGRIDVFPLERRVGYTILKNAFTATEREQIQDDPRAFSEFQPRLLLSRVIAQNAIQMKLFDRSFARLKESGRYDEIMATCAP